VDDFKGVFVVIVDRRTARSLSRNRRRHFRATDSGKRLRRQLEICPRLLLRLRRLLGRRTKILVQRQGDQTIRKKSIFFP